MFDLEIIELINEYKKLNSDYEKTKLKNTFTNLIKENPDKFNNFLEKYSAQVDDNIKTLFSQLENEIKNNINTTNNNKEEPQENDDVIIIKNYFTSWLNNYTDNNNQTNEQCNQIVKEIVKKYTEHKFDTIEKLLEIDNGEEYDKFKWHIKNNLRLYYATKVQNYITKLEEQNLSFLSKFKIKHQINKILKDIQNYKFNRNYMAEVLK